MAINWIVRSVKLEDAKGITEVLNPIIEEGLHTILDRPFSVDAEKQFILDFPKRGVFQVAIHPESLEVAGFQNVEPFAGYTCSFDHVGVIGTFVSSKYRRQGVAASLFQATFNEAKVQSYEKLFAYVRDNNKDAQATYLKQGFEVVGTAKKHAKVKGQYVDEILIEKFL